MKKRAITTKELAFIVAVCVAATILAGCGVTPSLQPLYTKKSRTYDPSLLGTWTGSVPAKRLGLNDRDDQKTPISLTLEALSGEGADSSSEVSYKITVKIDDDTRWYSGVLTEIDGQPYMDITILLEDEESGMELMKKVMYGEMILTHTFYRLKLQGDKLELAYFSMIRGWKKRKPVLAHEFTLEPIPHSLVTASTSKIREFMARHASKKGVFFKLGSFKRKPSDTRDAGSQENKNLP